MCPGQLELLSGNQGDEEKRSTSDCFNLAADGNITRYENQSQNQNVSNIVLLGPTGVGKSYFLNGLLGYTNPNAGIFPVGMTSRSCTRSISSVVGDFFDGKLRKYGMNELLLNVFDTPGIISTLFKNDLD